MKAEFNTNFYKPNRKYNRDFAENVLTQKGYSNFEFTGCSYSNGASFYFILEDGTRVRVSDHKLTGKRAFEYVQVNLVEMIEAPKPCAKILAKKEKEREDFRARLAEAIAMKNK